jgi:hypothetical protein
MVRNFPEKLFRTKVDQGYSLFLPSLPQVVEFGAAHFLDSMATFRDFIK